MAELVEVLLSRTAEEFCVLTRDASDKLWEISQNTTNSAADSVLKFTKSYHDLSHTFDKDYRSPYITELQVSDFDTEQVWQQLDLQTGAAARAVAEKFSTDDIETKLFSFVAAPSVRHYGQKAGETKVKKEKAETGKKDRTKNGAKKPALSDDDDRDNEMEVGSSGDDDSDSNSDAELEKIKKRIQAKDESDDDLFGGGDDTLFNMDEDEGDDDDNDEDDTEEEEAVHVKKKQKVERKKPSNASQVDDRFFKLSDMEAYLDQEDKKEEKKNKGKKEEEDSEDDDDEDMDYLNSDDDETTKNLKYSDYFDPPADGEMPEKQDDDEEADGAGGGFNDDEDDGDGEELLTMKKTVRFSEDTEEKESQQKAGDDKSKSKHEKRLERLKQQMQALEEQSLQPKTWQMTGEVTNKDREENSLLEVHLQTDATVVGAPEVTEELTRSVEDIIRQRIKDRAFDDNVRQVKKTQGNFQLKTQKTVNDEKSQLSLAEVYEQEYINNIAPKEDEVNPKHEEIQNMMKSLFSKLDALASWHYTPVQAVSELKVRSNLPAIRMEEATPITMATEGMLAPEEVKAKAKGEVKGKSERTKEDKGRERRQKKAEKRRKAKEREQREKAVDKVKPGLGNKHAKQRALKQLQKDAKDNLEVIEGKGMKKKLTSSKAFFTTLQEEVTTQINAKTAVVAKRKKANKLSSDKLLL